MFFLLEKEREKERLISRGTKRFNSEESALYMGHSNGKPKGERAFNSRDVRGAGVESRLDLGRSNRRRRRLVDDRLIATSS